MMPDLSIGEVARRSGLSASAVRYYERRGLLAPPPRRHGRRCYDPAIVPRVRTIVKARAAGLGLDAIEELLGAAGGRASFDLALGRQVEAVEQQIERLAELKEELERIGRCGCAVPAECTAFL
jgi:DNA-binding transcriptional MerR regulator